LKERIMMELMNAQAGGTEPLVKDITEAMFMQDVVEASKDVPVIVDFWAPWCGPCKTLGPALEQAVEAAGGKVRMVKINVDENQQIAAQLRVQSIPTVYAFVDGQPVDGFQGAQPPSEIAAFIDRVSKAGGNGGLDDALAAAEEMFGAGEVADAAQTYAAIIEADPNMTAAYLGLVRAQLALEQVAQAEAVLAAVPAELTGNHDIEAARAAIELARQAEDAGPVAELRGAVEADADDHQARFDLAVALNASGDVEGAVSELLELFRRDREWNDGAAKTQLFTIFDALPPQDPIALAGRRKLGSMILV
jgi:putative thioredoxin